MPKNQRVQVRVKEQEFLEIEENARKLQMNPSEYMRFLHKVLTPVFAGMKEDGLKSYFLLSEEEIKRNKEKLKEVLLEKEK